MLSAKQEIWIKIVTIVLYITWPIPWGAGKIGDDHRAGHRSNDMRTYTYWDVPRVFYPASFNPLIQSLFFIFLASSWVLHSCFPSYVEM
jgi:hypothetical protein